jgi:hypothetical protein
MIYDNDDIFQKPNNIRIKDLENDLKVDYKRHDLDSIFKHKLDIGWAI